MESRVQVPIANRQGRSTSRVLVLLAVTVIAIYVCYLLALPFLPALAWALTLTLVFLPAHKWIERRLRSRNLAAALSLIAIAAVLVAPGILLANMVVQEAVKGAAMINAKLSTGEWLRSLQANPYTAVVAQ